MPSPTWSKTSAAPIAAALAAAVHQAWMGPAEGASNRFLHALRQTLTPEEFAAVELLALQVFHHQPVPPSGYVVPPPSAHLELCPRCLKIRKTPFTAPQRGRIKMEALRDADWLQGQFEMGRSAKDVARITACTTSNVVRWADVHGIELPRTKSAAELNAQVSAMHRNGDAPGTIARALELPVYRIREVLKRTGMATKKKGQHYHAAEWWRVRLQDRGMTKAACAREAGIKSHNANYYLDKFGLQHLVDRNRKRTRKYPQLFDQAYLRDLLRRHDDNFESAAAEVGCAPTLISRRARDILGRDAKHSNHLPHSEPSWWRERLDAGMTTWEMAEEAGIEEKSAMERLRILGWTAEAYANNTARERKRRTA